MLNVGTVTVEAHYSTNYVENYLDSVENLPDDVQRHLSRIREIDVLYRGHLRDVNMYCDQWSVNQAQGTAAGTTKASANEAPSSATTEQSNILKRATSRIQKSLIAAQELGDEKLQIIQQLQDLIDHKTRQLDQDFMNLGNEFFVRLDYARDDKTDGGRDGNGTTVIGTLGGGSNSSNGPGQYGVTGNGTGNGPNASGGYGVSGAGNNSGNGGIGSNSHIMHTSNGTSGNGVNNTLGGGNGSGIYGGNNGSGSLSNERSSKRARRTRNDQTGGSANGSNTPNSMCGVSAMEVDPIEDILGGNSGVGSGVGILSGGSPGNAAGGNGGSAGSVTISSGGNGGQSVSGTVKQEAGTGGNGNGGNSGTGGSGNSHNIISTLAPGSGQNSSAGGNNGSKTGNNGGNGGTNSSSNASGSSGNNGNGNGSNSGGGAGSSNSQLNNSNQGAGGGGGSGGGGGKKGNGSGNNTASGSGASGANAGKKKKRKTGGRGSNATREAREDTPAAEETIDPDEPTYCLCDQISFGEMILCDNDLCPIEWFHFSCVSLISKPKGRWFCPNCRGDRPNVMKPKAQFLKELERYNKEKEEKT
ncbi:uncharacterized protein LOC128707449 [Anopheles marshallii]|uniref:uncharacterized protein LOC128707449 n=1 Tax=Anopheles marshallii TaxID=1521116 RepID=UPI00237BB220|nr:uncharacterized protein LOC128707449 [Anopheles marshallii]